MSRLYKFPESIQYQVKDSYFRYIEKNPDKLLKLNILWTKLNPNSIEALSELGAAYYISGDLDNALKSALVVFNLPASFDPYTNTTAVVSGLYFFSMFSGLYGLFS